MPLSLPNLVFMVNTSTTTAPGLLCVPPPCVIKVPFWPLAPVAPTLSLSDFIFVIVLGAILKE